MIDAGDFAVVLTVLCGAVMVIALVDRVREWQQLRRQPPPNHDVH